MTHRKIILLEVPLIGSEVYHYARPPQTIVCVKHITIGFLGYLKSIHLTILASSAKQLGIDRMISKGPVSSKISTEAICNYILCYGSKPHPYYF